MQPGSLAAGHNECERSHFRDMCSAISIQPEPGIRRQECGGGALAQCASKSLHQAQQIFPDIAPYPLASPFVRVLILQHSPIEIGV